MGVSLENASTCPSFPRKWESRPLPAFWIPACAGMTFLCSFVARRSIWVLLVLCLFLPALLYAGTAPNIPLDSWVYEYLESLDARGFIRSGILSTRPFSRLEGARLTGEAFAIWNSLPKARQEGMPSVPLMLRRLEREFQGDQITYGYFKPLDRAFRRH